ncbi:hypothetical protein POVCU2_0017750 [Plasmodium ovale curtisi]|uniref:Uncharacterized protein n=1 Tax=Plasmodium ovale curtisi TaxID=864141 RepID=A0A1A8VT83_PLAOA|nr:hypothetical protein POVCU2_0017750 [Plasmodium ovale curtisi]SBS88663.1 hypothetical protein POVCU1_015940 [Plasmodium ovale curtisi]
MGRGASKSEDVGGEKIWTGVCLFTYALLGISVEENPTRFGLFGGRKQYHPYERCVFILLFVCTKSVTLLNSEKVIKFISPLG